MSPTLTWFPQTKLHPPALRPDLIERPRLLALLQAHLAHHPLILLSAPAGYGKTTLLTQWLAQTTRPFAWLSLDEDDNDPVRFLLLVVNALQTLHPEVGKIALELLEGQARASQAPESGGRQRSIWRQITALLINDMLVYLPEPFVLLLDDVHLVSQPVIFKALDYLLAHIPPQMQLIMATRADPPLALARLQARAQVAELRLDDLRFNHSEMSAFLGDQQADLSALMSLSDGWPAGLRLLTMGSQSTSKTKSHLGGALGHQYLFDFLAREVLDEQEADVRTFLLQTSILTELDIPTCATVTQREQHQVERLLSTLYQRNLFLTVASPPELGGIKGGPTTDNPLLALPTYRYHDLFAEFLRRQLKREHPLEQSELYRRAALNQSPPEAIRYYLLGEAWDEAIELIVQIGQDYLDRGMFNTLHGWLLAIPEGERENSPWLNLFMGICASERQEFSLAQTYFERALAVFAYESQSDDFQVHLYTSMAGLAYYQSDYARFATYINQALALSPPPALQVYLLDGRAYLFVLQGQNEHLAQVSRDLATIEALSRTKKTSRMANRLVGLGSLLFLVVSGGAKHIEAIYQQLAAHAERGNLRFDREFYDQKSMIHLWRGRLEESIQAWQKGLGYAQHLQANMWGTGLSLYPGITRMIQGRFGLAISHFTQLLDEAQNDPWVHEALLPMYLCFFGRCLILAGEGQKANEIYQQLSAMAAQNELPMIKVVPEFMACLLLIEEKKFSQAEAKLNDILHIEEDIPQLKLVASTRTMLAYIYLETGRIEEALTEFTPLLAECEQQNSPFLILKECRLAVPLLRLAIARNIHAPFASRLLTGMGVDSQPTSPLPETGEMLTARELEVLHLLADGHSNREIAKQLVITVRTTKSHVSNILRKLNVSRRTQAVKKARQLGVIE